MSTSTARKKFEEMTMRMGVGVLLTMVALLTTCVFSSPAIAAGALSFGVDSAGQINGAANGDQTCSVDSAGDFNGDGIADTVIGACLADFNGRNNSGSVYVVYGKKGGLSTNTAIDLQMFNTNGRNDGVRIDGVPGPNCRENSTKGAPDWDWGGAHPVYEGSDADLCPETGFSVAGAGDFNRDGFDDIVIGARGVDQRRDADENKYKSTDQGAAYVVYGRRPLLKTIDLANVHHAIAMKILGDDDDDYYSEGAGSETRGDELGTSVDGAGDVNGDGYDDVVVGAPNSDQGAEDGRHDAGAAYIVYGNPLQLPSVDTRQHKSNEMAMITGERGAYWNRGNELGRAVAGAGDFNNDGLDDVILGAPGRDTDSYYWDPGCAGAQPSPYDNIAEPKDTCGKELGSAYVVLGRTKEQWVNYMDLQNNQQGVHRFWGKRVDDRLGTSVSSAGDVNGDGIDDVAIGSPREATNAGADAGAGYIWYGYNAKAGQQLPRSGFRVMGSPSSSAELGQAVSKIGDLNGDGRSEVAFAAPYENRGGGLLGGSDAGSVAVIYGKAGEGEVDTRVLADQGFWIDGAAGCPLSLCGPGGPRELSIIGSSFDIGAPADELGGGALIASNDYQVKLDNDALHNVAAAGDANGDGVPDILTGSHLASTMKRSGNGATYLVYGSTLAYEKEYTLKVGQDTTIVPTKLQSSTRTPAFEVDPPLPAGLSIGFGAKPGTITGSPQKAQPATQYTVTMDDPQGHIRASFTLKVEDDAAQNVPQGGANPAPNSDGSDSNGSTSSAPSDRVTVDSQGPSNGTNPRKRCTAVLGKSVRSASASLRGGMRARLTGPAKVQVNRVTEGAVFNVVATKGKTRALRKRITKATFYLRSSKRGGRLVRVAVDKRSPFSLHLRRKLSHGKYTLVARLKQRGKAKTRVLKLRFTVIGRCSKGLPR